MLQLKPLSREAIPKALEKADRYRLLNEPAEAESICMDVLEADPENQSALVTLILALTDQFGQHHFPMGQDRCEELVARLRDPYQRAYYSGVVCERRAKNAYHGPMGGSAAYEWFEDAMGHYEKAEAIRPSGNDDAVLRWNTCARIISHISDLQPQPEERIEPYLE
ncbi:MAG TPA: hypothetical protein VMS98_05035 [Thermoanaerobaculia bacterium]|nr:hypothetical protein [Thermoanaerobaculia bacterium]